MFHQFMMEISHSNVKFVNILKSFRKSDFKKHVASVQEGNKQFKFEVCDYSFFKIRT